VCGCVVRGQGSSHLVCMWFVYALTGASNCTRERDGFHRYDFVHRQSDGVIHSSTDVKSVIFPVDLRDSSVVTHDVDGRRSNQARIHQQGQRRFNVEWVATSETNKLRMTRHLIFTKIQP